MSEQTTQPADAAPANPDVIELTLAHHLTWPPRAVAADEHRDYAPGDPLTVTRDEARGIIAAGYSTVDAEDPKAVAAALKLTGDTATKPGVTVDYGAAGQGVGELHSGPPVAPPAATSSPAGEAGLADRAGRSVQPGDSWRLAELQALARARGVSDDGTKADLLERIGQATAE